MRTSRRKNLVVVCAGDESLHPRYAEQHRSYDLCIVYFGGQANRYRDHCEHYFPAKGLQMELLARLFRKKPHLIDQYERFWLPDDDLETSTDDVNRLFELFQGSDFFIAQPSLTADSDASLSMLTCKQLGSCEIDFVEVMCPLFTRESLRQSVPYLKESATGWGVDELWSVHVLRQGKKLGIFDQVQVGHYRPVGSAEWYQSLPLNPFEELQNLSERHGLENRIKRRLHPDFDVTAKCPKNELPGNSPVIIGGLEDSCTRNVAEILLRSNRMYLDLDDAANKPQSLDSPSVGSINHGSGLAARELVSAILDASGSTDYQMEYLPAELQQDIRSRGQKMKVLLAERARDDEGMINVMQRLGEHWHQRYHWGWKHSSNLYYLPLWKELYGRFRFVHIVRDPRRNGSPTRMSEPILCQGFLEEVPGAGNEHFEQFWAMVNLGVFHWAMREIPLDYLLLRAEDLAGQDEKARRETSRLLNFVGLDFVERSKTDSVFQLMEESRLTPRTGLVSEALSVFGYESG